MLNAFYDLAVSPAKYDFIGFLLDAERYRQMTGEDGIRFIFVPGPNDGFRVDKLPPHTPELRARMLNNILFPMCGMIDTKVEVYMCAKREDALKFEEGEIFPSEYRVGNPTSHYGTHIFIRHFKRGNFPLKAAYQIEKQPELITISLRESHYWPNRNSNREHWFEAAKIIKEAGLRVLFIPDVDSPPVEGWDVDVLSCTDLNRRAAIYESAAHNFFVSNGPAWMAAAMGSVNATMFKLLVKDTPLCTAKFYNAVWFPVGSQIGRDNHRIVWASDTMQAIIPVVENVIKGIL